MLFLLMIVYKEEDPLSSDKNTCNAKNSNLFTGSSSAVFKHPPVSTTYNGSSNSVTSVNIVALKVVRLFKLMNESLVNY